MARALPEGGSDTAFAGDGTVILSNPNEVQRGLAVAVQPDGRVVIGGRTASCSRVAINFLLLRLTAGGAPDPTFNAGFPASLSGGPTSVADLAIQAHGKIVAAIDTFVGPATVPARDDAFTVVRFNPDGTPDAGFGSGGVAAALFGAGIDATASSVVLQGGKVVVGGSAGGNFALARFNQNATADTGCALSGTVVTDLGGTDTLNALVVQPDGKLVAAGQTGTDVAVARYGAAPVSTTSTTSTTTTSTTVPFPAGGLCPVLAQVRSLFAASPFLSPFVSIIDGLRAIFGCG